MGGWDEGERDNCSTLPILRQKLIDFLHRHRRAVKIALRLITIQQPQQLELLVGLDAFGHGSVSRAS